MNYSQLVEEITRLVMEELQKASTGNTGGNPEESRSQVIVLLDEETEDPGSILETLGKVSGGVPNYHVVIPQCLEDAVKAASGSFSYNPVTGLKRNRFKSLVSRADRVVIPFLSVTTLSKIAAMIGDEPVSGVCLQALLQGKPVAVCADNIHSLNYSGVNTGGKLMAAIRHNMEVLKELGIEILQLNSLPGNVPAKKADPATPTVGVKNVVTAGDVAVAAEQKLKLLNFPRGTIVTPLAFDKAKELGIEIRLV